MAARGLQRWAAHHPSPPTTAAWRALATAFDLPPGSALAYYPEANVLCGTAVDPRSKTPAFKSVPIWIEA